MSHKHLSPTTQHSLVSFSTQDEHLRGDGAGLQEFNTSQYCTRVAAIHRARSILKLKAYLSLNPQGCTPVRILIPQT